MKKSLHILCHTHWDREWYQNFQEYRMRLVYQTDHLLDILDNNKDFTFHMDGQTSWIDDYLEISNENEKKLRKYIKNGRIVIGPWFVMPDELLLSGESITRNLLLGHEICKNYETNPMPVGYVTDVFGHISQFPQICQGFNVDTTFLHRGTSAENETTEMFWEGADNSKLLLIKIFPETGYQDFLTYRGKTNEEISEYEKKKLALSVTGIMFAMDGNDHQPPRIDVHEKADWMNSIFKETIAKASSMNDFLKELNEHLNLVEDKFNIKTFKGELRTPAKDGLWNEVFNGIASARVYLKQRNDSSEYILSRVSEQLNSFAMINGNEDQTRFLKKAWKYLMLNHPHDSIVGCSQDQVHQDMLYRFDQTDEIANAVIWDTLTNIPINTSAISENEKTVTIHNQSSINTDEISRFRFDVPETELEEMAKKNLIPILLDENGNKVEFVIEKKETKVWKEPFLKKTRGRLANYLTADDVWIERRRFNIAAKISIPAFGYKTLKISYAPSEKNAKTEISENSIENAYLKIMANSNGTIDITDKILNISYKNQGIIEDCGDKGNGWDHFYPEMDKKIYSNEVLKDLEIKTSGNKLSQTLEISYKMLIPKDLSISREERSFDTVENKIKLKYILDFNSKCLNCKTVIKNKAKNHRMRVLFPTYFKTNTWFADSAFDIIERNIKLIDTTGWKEQIREETPFKNFMAIKEDNKGIAIMTKGLCEGAVIDNEKRELALTLFRGFSENLYGIWSETSQMSGENTFEYTIRSFEYSDFSSLSRILKEAEFLKIKLYSIVESPQKGTLPPTASFMSIENPNLITSTLKISEDKNAYILRLFNPSPTEINSEIHFINKINKAILTNLKEDEILDKDTQNKLELINSNNINVTVGAKKIINIKLELKSI